MANHLRGARTIIVSIALLLTGSACEDKVDGVLPCTFPSSNSKFPSVFSGCQDCQINLTFQNHVYKFANNQVGVLNDSHCYFDKGEPYCDGFSDAYSTSFLKFTISSPTNDQAFFASIGQKQPLLTPDSLRTLRYPAMTSSLTIFDYCRNEFHGSNTIDPARSYNQIDSVQLLSEVPILFDENQVLTMVQKTYQCYGSFNTTTIVEGKQEPLIGTYTIYFSFLTAP